MFGDGRFVSANAERVMSDIATRAPLAANWMPVLVCLLAAGCLLDEAAYNVFFHQLARFPGPLSGRASLVWLVCCSQPFAGLKNPHRNREVASTVRYAGYTPASYC